MTLHLFDVRLTCLINITHLIN